MVDLSGKVAVVTGGASGIGYALAEMWLDNGMKVVLADIEEDALETAADKLGERGKVMAVLTDVSLAESVDELAKQADGFGQIGVVCNNAGVGGASMSTTWENPLADWEWVIGVNLWGVVNGIRAFLPRMVARNEGHIVNTASVAGLLPFPFASPYAATKHAVVGLSLSLQQELAMIGSNVHVSLLCPGWVRTRIADSTRNWPERLGALPQADTNENLPMMRAMLESLVSGGMDPGDVAQQVLGAVQEQRFWVLANAESFASAIQDLATSAVEGRDPPLSRLG